MATRMLKVKLEENNLNLNNFQSELDEFTGNNDEVQFASEFQKS
jgi:hypothetical protein